MDVQAQINGLQAQINSMQGSKDISRDNETALRERLGLDSTTSLLPSGSMVAYGSTTAPSGWLICDGSEVAQAQYANLYAAIGTNFNTGGEAAGNFRLPDGRTNTLAGYKSGDANFGFFGAALGSASHSLTIAEMPSHNHPGTYGSNLYNINGANGTTLAQGTSPVTLVTPGIVPEGGGTAFKLIQPTLTISWIIKT